MLNVDRFLVVCVVLVSGHPVVLQAFPEAVLLSFLGILVSVGVLRNTRLTNADVAICSCFLVISLVHLTVFPNAIASAVVGFLVRLAIALLAIRALRDFHTHYIATLYFLAILSTGFFTFDLALAAIGIGPDSIFPGMSLASTDVFHIGIHNFHRLDEVRRNSGIFWEPGAFAGYLLLAIVFLAARRHYYTKWEYRSRLIAYTIALLSTLSTTGYLFLPLALALHVPGLPHTLSKGLRAAVWLVLLTIAVGAMLFIGRELPFLFTKISEQTERTLAQAEGAETTRIGSLIFDVPFIIEKPLLGWSPHPVTRSKADPYIHDALAAQGNGLSNFIVKFGFLGFLTFSGAALFAFLRIFQWRWLRAITALTIVLGTLNGEMFLNYPLFLVLMFPIRSKGIVQSSTTRPPRQMAETMRQGGAIA